MLLTDGGEFECASCPPDVRVKRRCPKPHADKAILKRLRQMTQRPPDPDHPDACVRLKYERIERDARLPGWLGDLKRYRTGHLYRAGGMADQPPLWLRVMEILDDEVKAVHADRLEEDMGEAKKKGPKTPSADAERFPAVRPPYGMKSPKRRD